MIPTSRLFTFLDEKSGFAFHILEGQKLINDLAIIHELKAHQFSFFRDTVLATQPLISFLKKGEGLGFYLDSKDPSYTFKIETHFNGKMRTLFISDEFDSPLTKVNAIVRLAKVLPNAKHPYTSTLSSDGKNLEEIVNTILKDSYQISARIHISQSSDQSILIMRLPELNVDKSVLSERVSLDEYWPLHLKVFNDFFQLGETSEKAIIRFFEQRNFLYLQNKEVKFECPCGRQRMIHGLQGLYNSDPLSLFDEGKDELEVKCDYCNTYYQILKSELAPN